MSIWLIFSVMFVCSAINTVAAIGDIKAPVVVTECGGHHRFSPRSPVLRLTVSGKANCVWSFESIDFHDIYVDPIVHADQNCAHVSGHLRFETPAGTSLGRLDVCTPRGDAVQSVQPITKKLFQIRLLSSLGLEAGNFSITLIARPFYKLSCNSKDFIVTLPLDRVDHPQRYPYENYQLLDSHCRAALNNDSLTLSGQYTLCGTTYSTSAMGFVNAVIMKPKTNIVSRPILRIPLTCENTAAEEIVSKSYQLVRGHRSGRSRRSPNGEDLFQKSVSELKVEEVIPINVEMSPLGGEFRLNITINVYDNDEFHPNGQANMWEPNLVYFDVNAPEAPENVIVAARDCWIATSPNPEDSNRFLFLKDGCPYTADPVERFPSHENSDRFSIGSIELTPYSANVHHIHCSTRICSATDPGDAARCDKSCNTVAAAATLAAPHLGGIVGVVKDARQSNNLAAVQVSLHHPVTWQVTTTNANGSYGFSGLQPGGDYSVTFEAIGYHRAAIHSISVLAGEDTVLETLLYIEEVIVGEGEVSGIIINAVTGQPEPEVFLAFHVGVNSPSGPIVHTGATEVDGTYHASLDTGHYTLQLSKPDFTTTYITVTVLGGLSRPNQNGIISPVLQHDGMIRVVLQWGETPRDLDSHMSGPIAGSGGRFHVFFGQKGSPGQLPFTSLDVDDTTSYGPETVTVEQQAMGVYRYLVHDFTNGAVVQGSYALANSGAHVKVYRGESLFKTYHVPAGEGTLWTVFELSGSEINLLNTIAYTSDPHGASRTNQSAITDGELFTDLPAKVH